MVDAFEIIVIFEESFSHAKVLERQGTKKNICLIQYEM
jgi:hypothetical protein